MLVDETDAEMRAYAEEELAKLEARVGDVEEELEGSAAAERSERRKERGPRNSRRDGRR